MASRGIVLMFDFTMVMIIYVLYLTDGTAVIAIFNQILSQYGVVGPNWTAGDVAGLATLAANLELILRGAWILFGLGFLFHGFFVAFQKEPTAEAFGWSG
jgi:hypothetical protein